MDRESYLSDYVYSLIYSVDQAAPGDVCEACASIWTNSHDFILNFEYLATACISKNETDAIDLHESSLRLSKRIKQISTLLNKEKEHGFNDLRFIPYFIDDQQECKTVRSYYDRLLIVNSDDNYLAYESLLFLFVIFERNLRLLVKKFKSNELLLRDLILNEDLEALLTLDFINVLKCLIGSPLSLNLRNLVWHGFLQPTECSKHYSIFLILIFNFIGSKIEHSKPGRKPSNFKPISIYNSKLNGNFDLTVHEDIQSLVAKSTILPEAKRDLLVYIFKLNLIDKLYLKSIALLLPQLEFLLRKLYVIVNNVDSKHNLCAQEKHFYLTMNELLAEHVTVHEQQNIKNKLVNRLGTSCFLLFYDVFMFEDGPRLRDRLSHGEYQLNEDDAWKALSDSILYLTLCLLNETSKISNDHYVCVWHPLMCLKNELLDQLRFIRSDKEVNLNSALTDRIFDLVEQKSNRQGLTKSFISNLIELKLNFSVLYLYSSDTDNLYSKYIGLTRGLIEKCKSISVNLNEYFENTLEKSKAQQLHSRNRLNFELFRKSYDLYVEALLSLLTLCFYVYLLLGFKKSAVLIADNFFKFNQKLLIHFDKFLNLARSNRWNDCNLHLNQFYSKLNEYFE
jgi:hypothetical protein